MAWKNVKENGKREEREEKRRGEKESSGKKCGVKNTTGQYQRIEAEEETQKRISLLFE